LQAEWKAIGEIQQCAIRNLPDALLGDLKLSDSNLFGKSNFVLDELKQLLKADD